MIRTTTEPRLAAALVLLGALFASPMLSAQSADDLLTARSLATEAGKKKGADPKGAVDLFNRAFALAPSPSVRLETGRLHAVLGELIEAESDFREAMTVTKKGEPHPWKEARAAAADEITKLEGRAPFVVLTVPPDVKTTVRISIDGKPVPAAAIGVRRVTNPGTRVVTAEADGYKPLRKEVTLKERQVLDVPLLLEPAPAAAVVALPAASSGEPPPAAPSSVPVAPPPPVAPSPPAPLERGGYGLSVGGFTTSAIFAGVGITMGVLAKNKFGQFKNECVDKHCPPDKKSEGDEARVYAGISTGSFVVSGAFAIVGIVGIFTGGRPVSRAALVPAYDGRQLLLRGSF